MTSAIVARVGPHYDVADLAKHSSVPVINALSDLYHPLQIIADFLTIAEVNMASSGPSLGLEGMKIAWIGDANNVLFDMAIGAMKLGVDIAVATPQGYSIPDDMRRVIDQAAETAPKAGKLIETTVPEEAIKGADILVTDTWVSMGQEEETAKRLAAFKGFQITSELAKRGGAKDSWAFMHCLPRHPEEVSDEVFYGPRSVVFREAENRLWAAICEYLFFNVLLPILTDMKLLLRLSLSTRVKYTKNLHVVCWMDHILGGDHGVQSSVNIVTKSGVYKHVEFCDIIFHITQTRTSHSKCQSLCIFTLHHRRASYLYQTTQRPPLCPYRILMQLMLV